MFRPTIRRRTRHIAGPVSALDLTEARSLRLHLPHDGSHRTPAEVDGPLGSLSVATQADRSVAAGVTG